MSDGAMNTKYNKLAIHERKHGLYAAHSSADAQPAGSYEHPAAYYMHIVAYEHRGAALGSQFLRTTRPTRV
eukprot:scaffold277330_cov36-Tisochrysis_lutea.AAC.3